MCLNDLTERLLVDLMSETFNSSHQPAVPCNGVQPYCSVRSSSPSLLDTILCSTYLMYCPNHVRSPCCICTHYNYWKIKFFTYLVFFLSFLSSFYLFFFPRSPLNYSAYSEINSSALDFLPSVCGAWCQRGGLLSDRVTRCYCTT